MSQQSAGSRADMDEIHAYEAALDYRRFIAMLVCSRKQCQEAVAVCGDTHENIYYDHDGSVANHTIYEPKMMLPGPPLATIPPDTPERVVEAMRQCFSLFWADLGSAANKLRVAAERILDDQKVKRTSTNKARKRVPLMFAARIDIYEAKKPGQKEMLTALRWIGNEGSHAGDLDREDVLTGFELMQAGLSDLYGKDYKKDLAKRMKSIVARRGRPLKARR